MRASTLLLTLSALCTSSALASPAGQLPDLAHDLVDWSFGSSHKAAADSGVHAQGAWTFVDCGEWAAFCVGGKSG